MRNAVLEPSHFFIRDIRPGAVIIVQLTCRSQDNQIAQHRRRIAAIDIGRIRQCNHLEAVRVAAARRQFSREWVDGSMASLWPRCVRLALMHGVLHKKRGRQLWGAYSTNVFLLNTHFVTLSFLAHATPFTFQGGVVFVLTKKEKGTRKGG